MILVLIGMACLAAAIVDACGLLLTGTPVLAWIAGGLLAPQLAPWLERIRATPPPESS